MVEFLSLLSLFVSSIELLDSHQLKHYGEGLHLPGSTATGLNQQAGAFTVDP